MIVSVTPNPLLRFFVRHANAANLFMVILVALGTFSLAQLNRQFLPEANVPVIWISIVWSGASAEDVEANIIDVVEPEVRFINGVKEVSSSAREGYGSVSLHFEPGTNMTEALSEVESSVSRIGTLPRDAERPVVGRAQIYETVMSLAISGPFSETALRRYAKDIRERLLAVGVDQVNIRGMRSQEILVEVPQQELYRLDLTLDDIAQRIRSLNQDLPAGVLEGHFERQLRSSGLVTDADSIARLEIRAPESGEKLLLRDMARVTEDFGREDEQLYRHRTPAITLDIQRAASADSLVVTGLVNAALEDIFAELPSSLRVEKYDTSTDFLIGRIQLLVENGVGGLLLVLLVLFLFLDFRATFWVAAGIPITLFATFAVMYWSGQSINMVSLFALIMTIGIIVDDAIVVGEHIVAREEAGESAVIAAENGVTRMSGPVTASILTTIAAFAPIFLIGDVIGQIMSAIPLVVIAALISSMGECFLILPNHLAHSRQASPSRWRQKFNAGFNRLRDDFFGPFSAFCYDWRYTTIAFALGSLLLCLGLFMSGRVGFNFFPSPESEVIQANVVLEQGSSREETLQVLWQVEDALEKVAFSLAEGEPTPIRLALLSAGSAAGVGGANRGEMFVELTPSEVRSVRTTPLVEAWRASMPDVPGVESISVLELRGGPPGRDIDIRFVDGSAEQLKSAAVELRKRLASFNGVYGIEDDLPYGKRELLLELTPRGTALGFTTENVGQQLRNAFDGIIAKRFPRGDEEITIRVSLPRNDSETFDLRRLYLTSPGGERVLLDEVVSLREKSGLAQIIRRDGERSISVTASVNPEVTGGNQIIEQLEEKDLPEISDTYGVNYNFGGRAAEQQETASDFSLGGALAAAMIYIILAWVSKSYTRPVVVMAIIPFGLVGAVLGHWMMGYDLSVLSLMALMGLAGILVNDSIILITHIDSLIAAGQETRAAVIQGIKDRLRAVILTSLTTIFGLLPLLFETSLQAQFLIPMAITLAWGVGVGTVLVLVLAPSILGVQEDFKRITAKWREMNKRMATT
ncbi:MAG: efflux RND transporter permease subunit [Hyphomicrobiales bacterium]|nr:efflux RND transporter permease subunit [Hyphomicrobiales bacterium]MCY4033314.1 efflux RND transporter permease subunit [Hyphomicrobiales bacterium]MCY4038505.1 efflux RND transporter permease subunit [Hyphomicrobiales bacterium]